MDSTLPLRRPYPPLYPLRLKPSLERRVWGGQRLSALLGSAGAPAGPVGEPLGEAWLAGEHNVVLNGPLAGRTVGELAAAYGGRLVGSAPFSRYGARMPLLAKLLDAGADLSVQVHPDDDYAAQHEAATGHLGKSEAWYVLDAAAGSGALWGFERALTPDELRAAAVKGELPALMRRVPLRAGDVLANPPGTVHAALAGLFFYEIQQSSDITYRLYDYGRPGADGKPRELHLERGAEVADLSGAPPGARGPQQVSGGWERLVDSAEFVLDRCRVGPGEERTLAPSAATLGLVTVVSGEFTLRPADGGAEREALRLREFETVLLPAGLGRVVVLEGQGELLRAASGVGPGGVGGAGRGAGAW